jgi:D-tagatose-1,6-bisphosphate aldolase subunit GatZ/KbaZ
MRVELRELASLARSGTPCGVTSVCSAHPLVLRAAIRFGKRHDSTILIEATCNQVNHQGGYTGMRPRDFADLVDGIAEEENCPKDLIVLGGDHLGPNPWRSQPAEEAMAEAEKMVDAYVSAGFRKIHLDASMGCEGEPVALDDETTALRAARLAGVAERAARKSGGELPVYVIGTEVPPPGGADHVLSAIEPTSPDAVRKTLAIHRKVFSDMGLSDAFSRSIGLVVQPGVEFGNHNVIAYDRTKAVALSRVLEEEPQFVFEAHSTDYQGVQRLRELVEDGFPILKVGPELTFVLRESLYGLDMIASELVEGYGDRPLAKAMESVMLVDPANWVKHYSGSAHAQKMLRHFSLSDRIRYYWPVKQAVIAVNQLFDCLRGQRIPMPLLAQYLPHAVQFADKPLAPEEVVIHAVMRSLAAYHSACNHASAHSTFKESDYVIPS